jgi:hypothetical protein
MAEDMKALLVLVAATAVARADNYVQVDGSVGVAAPVAGYNAMLGVEAGHRLLDPLWAHGEIGAGLAADDQGNGTNMLVRAGVELHGCATPRVCGITGLDLGYQHGTWASRQDMSTEASNALVAIPRVALDLGIGVQTRIRVGIELDAALAGMHESGVEIAGHRTLIGAELFTGVARTW